MTLNAPWLWACFFCGVDSRALLYFFVVFVICVVLATLSFLLWASAKGDFANVEGVKYDIFNDPERGQPDAVSVEPLNKKDQADD